IGELAVREQLLDQSQVDWILKEQQQCGLRFGEAAICLGLLEEDQLVNLLALQQEDPLRLCAAIRKLRLIDESRLRPLLDEYLELSKSKTIGQTAAAVV